MPIALFFIVGLVFYSSVNNQNNGIQKNDPEKVEIITTAKNKPSVEEIKPEPVKEEIKPEPVKEEIKPEPVKEEIKP